MRLAASPAAGLLALLLVAGASAQPGYRTETLLDGLDHPWCVAWLPDGAMLVTERPGRLLRLRREGAEPESIGGVPGVYVRSQAGLFDVLPDPRFADNHVLYLSYAHGTDRSNTLRVARATLWNGALEDQTVIFEGTPTRDTPVHFGGRMAFLPDGTLLITTGEGFDDREEAQRLDNHLGKTVRIRPDGTAPPDNPFTGQPGARPEIWTYGHRNPQGLAVDAGSGRVYLHEHGPRGGDELNLLEPGANYGWPVITYGIDYSGARISPYTEWPGMRQPLVHWTPSIAPAGMTLYTGDVFPAWRGDLFVAALIERRVRRIDLEEGRVAGQSVLRLDLAERFRDVRQGPDGFLYLLTDSEDGRLLRLRPEAPSPASLP